MFTQRIRHCWATMAVLLCSIAVSAHEFELDGIYYNITSEADKTLEVTYKGDNSWDYDEYSGSITLPATVTYNGAEYSVTSIGEYAFSGCSSLTAITIPEGVTSIGDNAFRSCSDLTSITFPEGVTSIGEWAFVWCESLTDITIPEGVTWIRMGTFSSCSKLIAITIPEGVIGIEAGAFYECTSLTTITFPTNSQLMHIGDYTFEGCSSLTAINIPEGVTHIGYWTFEYCISLTTITCHAATPPTIDGSYTFNGVDKSIPVYVPAGSVEAYKSAEHWSEFTNIQAIPSNDIASGICGDNLTWKLTEEYELFIEGTGAMYDYEYGNAPWYEYREMINMVILPDGLTSIGSCAFSNCSSLTAITLPESIVSIGEYAFESSSSLISITIPKSVTSIGYDAFWGCKSLTSITIPEGVTSIGGLAFCACNLICINIPASVTSIGKGAFANNPDLAEIVVNQGNSYYDSRNNCNAIIEKANGQLVAGCTSTLIPEGVTTIGYGAFCASNLSSIDIPKSVTTIGEYAFSSCRNLIDVNISENSQLTTIEMLAFYDCSSLTAITIPEDSKLTSIGDYAFYVCRSLTTITIPESVTSIGAGAFEGCTSLTAITIPESVTSIGHAAFHSCSSLTAITIPESVTSIGEWAFRGCSSLTAITCDAATPPTIYSNTFYSVDKSIPVYVPVGSVDTYKAASYWNEFENIQPIEEPLPATVTIKISQYGSGTYSSEYALDFTDVQGLKAYVATGYDHLTGEVTLLRVRAVDGGTGLLIKGKPNTSYEVPVIESTAYHTLNMLVATLEKTPVNSQSDDGIYANYKYTVVKEQSPEPLFYKFTDGSNLSAGKAYLQIPMAWLPATGQKALRYRFDEGETTDIDETTDDGGQSTVIYDLMGRRVASPKKGEVYIINNKKVVY